MYPPTWKRWLILAFGLLENLVFSGSILGWAPLNYMLKEEGIFSDTCISSDPPNLIARHSSSPPAFNSSTWTSTSASTSPSSLTAEDTLVNNFINYSVIPELPSLPESDLIMNTTSKQVSEQPLWPAWKAELFHHFCDDHYNLIWSIENAEEKRWGKEKEMRERDAKSGKIRGKGKRGNPLVEKWGGRNTFEQS